MYFAKGILLSGVSETEVSGKKYYKVAVLIGEKDKAGFMDPNKVELGIVRSTEPLLQGKELKYGLPILVEVDVSTYDGQTRIKYSNPQLISG